MKYISMMTLLGLSMVFAIACSSTAEPEVIVQEVIKEVEVVKEVEVEKEVEVVKEVEVEK